MIYGLKIGNISIEDIILKHSLYQSVKLSVNDLEGLEELKNAQVESNKAFKLDGFCPKCNNITTFIRTLGSDDKEFMSQTIRKNVVYQKNISEEEQKRYKEIIFETFIAKYAIINMLFKCSRNEEHHMQVSFYIDKDKKTIQKVGQYPSYSDLNNEEFKDYKKELGDYYDQYVKAIRLYGSGIGCGSYVYLRRIFENLIEKKHTEIKGSDKWIKEKEEQYTHSEMKDKIKMLKNELPEFLVDNRTQMYSILSKGIHQLSEEECLEYFEILKKAILFILEDEHSRIKKQKLQKDLSNDLNSIHSNLKGND